MTRRLAAVLGGVLFAVVAFVGTAAPAHAHALLTSSTPADGASVEQPPAQVLLSFTETLDPALSVVRVLDASGTEIEARRGESIASQPAQLALALGELAQGTFTVTWRVTSALDGHTTTGSVAFGVGVPAVAAGTEGGQAVEGPPAPTATSVAGRWLFYVGVVLLLGAAVVGVVVVSNPLVIAQRVLVGAWAAAAGGLLLTIADQVSSTGTSFTNLFSSSTGDKLTAQAGAVALAGMAVFWACLRPSRFALALVGGGASVAMLTRALAGHANASSVRWFTVGMQWVHLVSVGAWVGGLVWLLLALRRGDPGQGPGLARRFSTVAAGTLAVVVVSGTARALDEVGAWSRLVDTPFGVTLLVKIAFFTALVGLGARSRFRHVRAASPARVGGLRRLVRGEVAIAAGVLGVTAVLAGLAPSASLAAASEEIPNPAVTVTGNDFATSVRVRLAVTPGSAGPNRFDAAVEDYDSGEPVPAETVTLRFQLEDRPDVAATTLDLTQDPDAHWRGSGNQLSIHGRWTVTALVQTPTDAVEVPMTLETATATPEPPAAGDRNCGQGTPDASYDVTIATDPDPPVAEGTTFSFTVRQDGEAVTGAKVCVDADMPGMEHPGVFTVASDDEPGTYEAKLELSMTGAWEGSVTIAEPGKPAVSVPLEFQVE